MVTSARMALPLNPAGAIAVGKMKRKAVLLGKMSEGLEREMKAWGPSHTEMLLGAPCGKR